MTHPPRPDWRARCEAIGFFHHSSETPNGPAYWREDAHYEISPEEVAKIEEAANGLHAMCRDAAARMAEDPALMLRAGVPANLVELARESWRNEDPTLYGRFDFATDGRRVKLLEYNADTPTALVETSLAQWHWLVDVDPPKAKAEWQFNWLHEALIARFKAFAPALGGATLHFACFETHLEDFATTEYLRDLAAQAGLATKFMPLGDVDHDDRDPAAPGYRDQDGQRLRFLFKLYPWEWLAKDDRDGRLARAYRGLGFLEPPWKAMLSTKGLLPVLWEMYPGHEWLLPAYFDRASFERAHGAQAPWIAKPLHGREGASLRHFDGERIRGTDGPYEAEAAIYQAWHAPPDFDGKRAIAGVWMVGDEACGLVMRESDAAIVGPGAQIVPHLMTGPFVA